MAKHKILIASGTYEYTPAQDSFQDISFDFQDKVHFH